MKRSAGWDVVVFGGAGIDYLARGPDLPSPTRAVQGQEFVRVAGGKGLNAAVAAARLGSRVALVACIGTDEAGAEVLARLARGEQAHEPPGEHRAQQDDPAWVAPFEASDHAAEIFEREKLSAFASKEGRYLYRIEEALDRLHNDPEIYGICRICGSRIPFERLDALPHVRHCLGCKIREE